MLIEDGTGSGFTVKVDAENRLRAYSVIETEALHVNEEEGQAYEMLALVTPDSVNPSVDIIETCFFYLKNSSDTDMVLSEFRIWVESNEYINLYLNQSGTPVNGNTNTPTNMNAGSGNLASGTFLTGTNITGMDGGTLIDRFRIPADNADHNFSWPSSIIIPKNNIITLITTTGGIPLEVSLSFYYHG